MVSRDKMNLLFLVLLVAAVALGESAYVRSDSSQQTDDGDFFVRQMDSSEETLDGSKDDDSWASSEEVEADMFVDELVRRGTEEQFNKETQKRVLPLAPQHRKGSKADCTDDEYFTQYGCRQKTPGESRWCPLYRSNPPVSGKASCVNGGNNFWYIHVGGKRTDWNRGTDAICLSVSSRPAVWGREHCHFSWNEEGCQEVLAWAGCTAVHRKGSKADCSDYEYFTQYGCHLKTPGQSQWCPLYGSNPPSDGAASCVNGGNNFWYIHVGGKRTDWNRGTDAMCLSVSSRPVAWGGEACQFSWRKQGCLNIQKLAGCGPPEHRQGSKADCTDDEYFTQYGCRQKTPGQSRWCPLYRSNPPVSGKASCVNGGNNFWYIHVGGKRTDWNRGTDAMCLSVSSRAVAWGGEACQFSWNQQGCQEVLAWAGCSAPEHSEGSNADCAAYEYFTGYGCRLQTPGRNEWCPLYESNPPPSGAPSCVNGGNNFWYIHVGGKRTDWNRGTDAMCLSVSSRPVAWGREACQFRWNQQGCLAVLAWAGCGPSYN